MVQLPYAPIPIHKKVRNQTLEERLAQAHKQYITEAKEQARILAASGKPHTQAKSLLPFIGSIQARYNGLIGYSNKQLDGVSYVYKAKRILAQLKAKPYTKKSISTHIKERTVLDCLERLIYARSIEDQIVHMYEEAVAIFIQTNLIARLDSEIPECFHAKPPALQRLFAPTNAK